MLRTILLLALHLLAPSSSFAEDFTCPMDGKADLTMQQYTQCLLDRYGQESLVTGGAVAGADKDGKVQFADEYAALKSSSSVVAMLTPVCTTVPNMPNSIIDSHLVGYYYWNWCAVPGSPRQAWRETWHWELGVWTLKELKILHCNVSAEYDQMWSTKVKTKICP